MTSGIVLFCDRPRCNATITRITGSITVALTAAHDAGWATPHARGKQLSYCPKHTTGLGYRGAPLLPAQPPHAPTTEKALAATKETH